MYFYGNYRIREILTNVTITKHITFILQMSQTSTSDDSEEDRRSPCARVEGKGGRGAGAGAGAEEDTSARRMWPASSGCKRHAYDPLRYERCNTV